MHDFWALFSFGFFQKALLAALFTSISAGIAGTYIVARRIVFISGGITHASFGGIGLAFLLGFNPLVGAALFAVMAAFGIQFFSEKIHLREDSAIAIWWSLGMALGIIFVFLTPGYTPNLMSYLFGNILTVSIQELWAMLLLLLLLTAFFARYFREILYISYDEEFARASGIPVSLLNYLIMVLIALVMVMNIRAVGIILILSLMTIPQATANLFTKDFRKMMILSVVFAFVGNITGLVISYFLNIPSGATIIFTLVILFALLKVVKTVTRNIPVKL
ncbi:MAG: metal ABC transporter permease [Prolixibacteraceae bacterium]|jgi:zinc transport system permease protein|nr:metal ABC transporter permease [Prolixibacteraceae bacterium]MDI9564037.1 metal ABC transporter permease [Bacteroidota bacterium]NLS98359.1 metal ABC transporter permease [Bacteroidales bacterium]OQB79355.1 MAG: High-affinity zinc uptake system membrane protein ZnuB [Bacteroidetes bacterium ADurb.Bin123]HNZ69892.1 metal ABC transporter permease [Prolixibacteraceae bacterium]